MRKFVLIIIAVMASAAMAQAQDLITRKNGEEIKAKVLEVSSDEVKYKLYDEPEGATYIVRKSELVMIRFESGRSEVFNENPESSLYYTDREPVEGLTIGMKYNELKRYYNVDEYIPTLADRYSPVWSGVASFFIPGLGQIVCNEPGRGFAFLGASVAGSVLGSVVMASSLSYNKYGEVTYVSPTASFAGFAIFLGVAALDIISIVDGVRVAKVKNMYEQDLRKAYSFDMSVCPSFDYAMVGNSYQPTAGLKLSVRF